MTPSPDTLLTGATGFLGRWLLISLTRRGRRVAAMVRNAEDRAPELVHFVDSRGGDGSLITCVEGDVCDDGLGLTVPLGNVRDVYHLAAAFDFGMDPKRARDINVGGTEHVLTWARALPRLRRFVYLGGYRATHMPAWLESAPFPLDRATQKRLYAELGAYEGSKYEAHLTARALSKAHDVPTTIVNPSTVIGDSRTGETTQITGLGEMVRDLHRGKLPALAGTANTFVPLVAVDYLAEVLATVPDSEETLGQELCVLDQKTPLLPHLIARVGELLGVEAPTRMVSTGLLRWLPKALTGVEPEALSFLTEDSYDTHTADVHAKAAGLAMPNLDATLERWVTHLVSSDFGTSAGNTSARFIAAAESRTYCLGDPTTADALFLHGIPWDSSSWEPVSSKLGLSGAHPDLPGLGRSSAMAAHASYDTWLTELVAERRKPALLVGHSLGTEVAVRHAAAHPQAASALVLVSPFFLQARPSWPLRQPAITSHVLAMGSATALQRNLIGEQDSLLEAVSNAHANLKRSGVARRTATALANAAQPNLREELRRLLATLEVPVLVIHGADDPLEHEAPAGVEVVRIPGGHSPHVSHPEQTAKAIRNWLNRLNRTHTPQPRLAAQL